MGLNTYKKKLWVKQKQHQKSFNLYETHLVFNQIRIIYLKNRVIIWFDFLWKLYPKLRPGQIMLAVNIIRPWHISFHKKLRWEVICVWLGFCRCNLARTTREHTSRTRAYTPRLSQVLFHYFTITPRHLQIILELPIVGKIIAYHSLIGEIIAYHDLIGWWI